MARNSLFRRCRHIFTSPTIRQGYRDIFPNGRRINVDVDKVGAYAELLEVTGDPVIEPGADGDDQICVVHGHVGGVGAVHAQHAQPQAVPAREAAERPSGCW